MKLLHTADWHLGKRLDNQERTAEHLLFFDWLIDLINQQKVNVLIIAGDIFDSAFPNNTALKIYYDFLRRLVQSHCSYTIIVGGNHDSPSMLNAPQDLLKIFNVSVLGGLSNDLKDHIIECKTGDQIELVVCASPFLRDRDLRVSMSGETFKEREDKVKAGIEQHYNDYIPLLTTYQQSNIPIVATGHLFMAGSSPSPDSEKDIYVGTLGQVHPSGFPDLFKYVALGHLHRAQTVGKYDHICYSGSPIPLSFSESKSSKYVNLVDCKQDTCVISPIEIPLFRPLIRLQGSLFKIKEALQTCEIPDAPLLAWVEIQLEITQYQANAEALFLGDIENRPIENLFIKQIQTLRKSSLVSEVEVNISLNELTPIKVFEKKCALDVPGQDVSAITTAFEQVLIEVMAPEL